MRQTLRGRHLQEGLRGAVSSSSHTSSKLVLPPGAGSRPRVLWDSRKAETRILFQRLVKITKLLEPYYVPGAGRRVFMCKLIQVP